VGTAGRPGRRARPPADAPGRRRIRPRDGRAAELQRLPTVTAIALGPLGPAALADLMTARAAAARSPASVTAPRPKNTGGRRPGPPISSAPRRCAPRSMTWRGGPGWARPTRPAPRPPGRQPRERARPRRAWPPSPSASARSSASSPRAAATGRSARRCSSRPRRPACTCPTSSASWASRAGPKPPPWPSGIPPPPTPGPGGAGRADPRVPVAASPLIPPFCGPCYSGQRRGSLLAPSRSLRCPCTRDSCIFRGSDVVSSHLQGRGRSQEGRAEP